MISRRSTLTGIDYDKYRHTANAGLWLDKFLTSSDDEAKHNLVTQVAGIPETRAYGAFYKRWCQALEKLGAKTRPAIVSGRMALGLGDESVLETSVTLHHTYGVPYIPGSALKGLAASYARQQLEDEKWKEGEYYKIVFGDMESAGYITFFDALYIPQSGYKGQALYTDVLTVHHQQYYQGAASPPADWDSPIPVPFLSVTGKYLIALTAPQDCEEWISRTFQILEYALKDAGIGAKTSSGYGRLRLEPSPIDTDQQKAEELIRDVERLPLSKVANEISGLVDRWRRLKISEAQRRRVAQAILKKNQDAGRDKAARDKPWYKELLASIKWAPVVS